MRLDIQGKQERIVPENGVYQKDGKKWFMRYDNKSDGAELPEDVAKVFKMALLMQKRVANKPNAVSQAIFQNINCHKLILYAIGLIDSKDPPATDYFDEGLQQDYAFLLFPKTAFKKFDSVDELSSYLKNEIKGSIGVVQFMSPPHPWFPAFLAHTFVAGADSRGRIICFEQHGVDEHSDIRTLSINEIYDGNKREGSWAAGSIDQVKESTFAIDMRANLEERKKKQNFNLNREE